MRRILGWGFMGGGEDDLEGCAVWGLGMELEASAVVGDDPFGEGEAEAGAVGFGREEGVEETSLDVLGDAGAVVGDFEDDGVLGGAVEAGGMGEGTEGDMAVVGDAVGGVLDEVDEGLGELLVVSVDEEVSGAGDGELDLFRGEGGLEEFEDGLEEVGDREGAEVGLGGAGELEELVDDAVESVEFEVDDGDVFEVMEVGGQG